MPSKKSCKKKKKRKKKHSKTKAIPSEKSMVKSMLYHCAELFFGIIGIIIIGIVYGIFWNNSPCAPLLAITLNPIPKIYNIYTDGIETILWKDIDGGTHLDKILNIGRMRKPILIKNSPAIYWKANRMWKLSQIEYLSKLHYKNNLKFHEIDENKDTNLENDIVSVHRINNSNFFTFQDKRRPFMTAYNMINNTKYDMHKIEVINVSFISFLQYINNKKYSSLNVNNSYLYYFNSARNVYQDLAPMSWFKMKDKNVHFTNNHIRELVDINEINLEISPHSFFINAYYDITHNFFYQICGERRILISPPSESVKLKSFPEGHPSYRSSQIYPYKFYFIPFNLWLTRKSHPFKPNNINIAAWNVTLQAMDLLYVPPFYWTQITTLQNSISIKSSSLGFEQIFTSLSATIMLPKILQNGADRNDILQQKHILHQLAFFTRCLIDKILKALPDKRDSTNNRLLSEFNDELEWDIIHQWISKQLVDGKYKGNLLWDDMKCAYFEAVKCPQHGNTTQDLMKDMQQTAKTWAFAYKQMKNYVTNGDDVYFIRNIMLTTHIEQFVSYITGHDNYCYFLQCLISQRFGNLYVETKQEERKRKMQHRMRQQQS